MPCLEQALASLERMPHLPSVKNFACVLHQCRKTKNLAHAKRVHAYMCKSGLEAHSSLGNYLVVILVEGGSICDAQQVSSKLVDRNVYSWTALITGYIDCGESQRALDLYQKMLEDYVHPSEYTFVALLKACARLKDMERGQAIHSEIGRRGLKIDIFLGSTLVNMYAKCGSLGKAQDVFDKLSVRDVVSWTALILAYAEHGCGQKALNCFEQMHLEGICPNALTFVSSLKACGSIGALDVGQEIHAEIARKGLLERHSFVGNALVDMYAKCGAIAKAREVFDNLSVQDVVSWTSLVTGYGDCGFGEEALKCFKHMQLQGLSPNAVTFVCSLKACGRIGAIEEGLEIHAELRRRGLGSDNILGNALVHMYVKCGSLARAREVFDKLQVRDVVSWNALITGYAKQGLGEKVLICFDQMQLEGFSPDAVTFVSSLQACGSIGAIDKGQKIHVEIARKGVLKWHPYVGNALVDMYAKCGALAKAREVFDKLPHPDVVSWTALIGGYAEWDLGEEALYCFEQMQLEGFPLDAVTFVCSLKACGSIGAIDKGQEIHAKIARNGLERDLVVGSTLVDMYVKCGSPAKAQVVFDKLPVRNEISWNALITGYAIYGPGEEALDCLHRMQLEGVSPNAVTLVCSLKACSNIGAIDKSLVICAEIAMKGLERDPFVGNTLVKMYAKFGSLAKAWEVFDNLLVRDVVSWNALISGYANHGLGEKALDCFECMQLEGVSPDAFTFACCLKACGIIGAIDKGQEIHADVAGTVLLQDLFVGNALIDMYAKCGSLAKAHEAFDKLPIRNEVSWNALISGYAHLGKSQNVFHMFERMEGEGIKPDGVTFLNILTVCSQTGLVDKGGKYFEAMSKDYGIIPTMEHHTCMVDLLGRAGQIDEAVGMMKKMPFHPDLVVCHTVLGACRKWGNVELGMYTFEHAVQLDEKDHAAYVLMSNIYADAHVLVDKKVEVMGQSTSMEDARTELDRCRNICAFSFGGGYKTFPEHKYFSPEGE